MLSFGNIKKLWTQALNLNYFKLLTNNTKKKIVAAWFSLLPWYIYKTKYLQLFTIIEWFNIKWDLSFSKITFANSCKPNHDIKPNLWPFKSGKCGKEKKSQKFGYLKNKKSFLNKTKNLFHNFWNTFGKI